MNSIRIFTVIHDEHFDRIPTAVNLTTKIGLAYHSFLSCWNLMDLKFLQQTKKQLEIKCVKVLGINSEKDLQEVAFRT